MLLVTHEGSRGPEKEGQWLLQYRRCATCGFMVRVVLRVVPNAVLLEKPITLALVTALVSHGEAAVELGDQ